MLRKKTCQLGKEVKMDKIFKISYGFSFVLAILLAFTLIKLPVVAASEGSLTIRKFDVNRYENLKESTGSVSDEANLPADAKAMADVEFKIEKLLVAQEDTEVTAANPIDTSFTARSKRTDNSGEVVFENLPIGYYLVSEVIPDGYDSPEDGKFVVAIPIVTKDSQDQKVYNYDVTVYPKNSKIQVEKIVDGTQKVVGVGDVVDWKVNYPVGSNLKGAKNFFITDEMDKRLDYVEGSAKLEYRDNAGKVINLNLIIGEDYAMNYDKETHVLTISFTDGVGTEKVADAKVKTIVLSISTIVNEDAIDTTTPLINNARIKYTNESGDPYEHEVFPPGTDPEDSRVPKVYLGSIEILKVDSQDESKVLEGATFTLKRGDKVVEVTTDKNGRATISAIGAGEYELIETKAPIGYKRIETPIKVEVTNDIDKRVTNLKISNVSDSAATPTATPTTKPGDGGIEKKGAGTGAKTGDTTQILGFVLLAIASMGIITVVLRKRKKV